MTDARVPLDELPEPELLGDRLLRAWRDLREGPGLALPAVAALGGVVTAVAARPRAVEVAGARVRCGLDTVAFGHSDAAIEQACRDGGGTHLLLAGIGAAIAIVAIGRLVVHALRRSRARDGLLAKVWRAATATAADRVLLAGTAVAGLVVALAATPVPYARLDAAPFASGRCGLDVLVLGHPQPPVDDLCRGLVDGRAWLVVPAALVLLGGGAVLATRVLRSFDARSAPGAIGRHRGAAVLFAAAGVAAVLVVMALRTVTVTVAEPTALTLRCSMDAWVVSGPTSAARAVCRDALDTQLATGVASATILAVVVVHLAVAARRRPSTNSGAP